MKRSIKDSEKVIYSLQMNSFLFKKVRFYDYTRDKDISIEM